MKKSMTNSVCSHLFFSMRVLPEELDIFQKNSPLLSARRSFLWRYEFSELYTTLRRSSCKAVYCFSTVEKWSICAVLLITVFRESWTLIVSKNRHKSITLVLFLIQKVFFVVGSLVSSLKKVWEQHRKCENRERKLWFGQHLPNNFYEIMKWVFIFWPRSWLLFHA